MAIVIGNKPSRVDELKEQLSTHGINECKRNWKRLCDSLQSVGVNMTKEQIDDYKCQIMIQQLNKEL